MGERRRVSEARETEPGAGNRRGRVRGQRRPESAGSKRQSPAQLSSLGDLGLTKPRAEWGAGRRWTLGLMFLEDPISRPTAGANLLGGAQTPASTRTEVQPQHRSPNGRVPLPILAGVIKGVRFSAGLGALVSLIGRQGSRFSTLRTVCASNNPLSRSPIQETGLTEAWSTEMPRPCAHRAETGLDCGPLHPPRTQLRRPSPPARHTAPWHLPGLSRTWDG